MREKKTVTPLPVTPTPKVVPPLQGVRLPPFNGNTACAKCGHRDAKTLYLPPGKVCAHCLGDGWHSVWGAERLHRMCVRCEFSWDEACVDPAEPAPEPMERNDPITKILPVCEG